MSPLRWLPFLLFVSLAGCRPAPPASQAVSPSVAFPKDDLGRDIALKSAAKRVIVIGPGAIESTFALDAGNQIVGRDSVADFPPAARKIAVAGDYQGPNVEKSIALRPDLVIVQGETYDRARLEKWQSQIGVPVAGLVATDLRGVQNGIKKIGKWLGVAQKAEKVAGEVRPQAFYWKTRGFIEVERSPLWTAGQKTLVDDVLTNGGFQNVAKVKGYQPFGLESLLAAQPDAYIVPSIAPRAAVLKELRASPTLSKLKCIRQGRVVVVDPSLILRPGPRLTQGMAILERESGRLAGVKGL